VGDFSKSSSSDDDDDSSSGGGNSSGSSEGSSVSGSVSSGEQNLMDCEEFCGPVNAPII
jgi:hypothetical protein